MRLTQDTKPWTEADEFRLGSRLFGEVKALVDAGQPVPDELAGALERFQAEAAAMAHSSDAEAADAWYGLWSSIEGGLREATSRQGYLDSLSAYGMEAMDPARSVSAGRALGGEEVRLPSAPAVEWTAPEPIEGMDGRPFELSPESVRRHSILNNPTTIDAAGRELVEDSEGEVWDLSEALAVFRDPRTRQELAQSMQELVPGHPAMANTLGAMGSYQALLRGAGRLDELTGAPPISNLRTAQPGLSLPWSLPSVPDLEEKLEDPLWTRGLLQVMGEMEAAGELQPGAMDVFVRATFGLADFVLFSKGLGAAGKAAGRAALAAGVPATSAPGMLAGRLAAGRAATTFPLNTHFGRMASDFMAYELGTRAFDDRTTVPEDLWHGFEQAAVFQVAGLAALATRRLLGVATRPLLKGTRLGEVEPSSMQPFERLYEHVRRFSGPTLSKALRNVEMAPAVRQGIAKSVDAYLTGAYAHAYGESEDFKGFWRSLLTPEAHATGLAFALNAAVQATLQTRKKIQEFMAGPIGQRMTRAIAERMASPRAGENHREIFRQFDEWRAAEPKAFEGLVKMNLPAQERVRREEVNLQAVRSIVGWRPDEAPPPDLTEPRPLELEGSSLERFRQLTSLGEAALTEGARQAQRVEYRLGELPLQTVKDVGFASHLHGLNAVHEYLRKVEENSETRYKHLHEVPRALWLRTLDWRDKGKPKAEPAMGELAELAEKAEAHPLFAGIEAIPSGAPVDVVTVSPLAKAGELRTRSVTRRPSLGRAIELVAEGKRDARWLGETFPEGAAAIGQGKVDQWAGSFERAVRAAWAQRNESRLARYRAEREAKSGTLQAFVRRKGGIRYSEDLRELTREEAGGRRPIVHRKGKEKGLTLDEMAEAAWEAGFFTERPTEREMIDALREDLPHPTYRAEAEARQYEREQGEIHGAQLRAYREELETGAVDLPDDPAARRKLILEVFAGDARFEGLSPERQERQLLELRAQAAAGDPGPVEAAPPETLRDRTLRAASSYRRLLDDLKAIEALDLEARPNEPAAMETVMRLVAGERLPGIPEAEVGEYVRRAREAREQHREVVRALLVESLGPGHKVQERIDLVWSAIDSKLAGRAMPAEVRAKLKELGWLDELGELKTFWHDKVQHDVSELLWQRTRAFEESDGLDFIHSGVPMPIAFGGRKFTRVEESGVGKWLNWQWIYQTRPFQQFMQSRVNRKLFRTLVNLGALPGINIFNVGPLSRPQDATTKRLVRVNQLYRGLTASKTRATEMRASALVSELFSAFGGRRIPQDHSDFYDWGHASGAFRNATGPKDFERLKAGTGYLWGIYTRMADVKREIARQAHAIGLLNKEQMDALDGRYLMQASVRAELDGYAEALGRGEIPVAGTGRAMMRDNAMPLLTEAAMKVNDAAYQEMKGIRDWSVMLRVVSDWWQPIRSGALRTQAEIAEMHPLVREDFARAGVRIRVPAGSNLVQEVADMARTGRWEPETLVLSARLLKLQELMAKEGEPPSPGQIPYSEQLDALIRTYLDGGLYLPKGIMREMDIASEELFTSPGDSALAKIGRALDIFGGFSKRGLTAMRPAAITLDYISSAINNHVGRAVPLWDFLAGHAGIRSFTSDGLRGGQLYMRWVREGLPKERPEGWTESDWADVVRARKFLDAAQYSTSVFAVIGPEIAEAYGMALTNPYSLRSALSKELEHQAERVGLRPTAKDRLLVRIAEIARGQARGLESVDMKIAEAMGEADPAAHARGVAMFSAYRHLIEVFAFKYPAFLKAQHEWPDASYSEVLEYALEKTSNIGDTHPALRRWLSMHTPWNDRLWRAAQGAVKLPGTTKYVPKDVPKMLVAQLLRNRFYTYPATMAPQFLKWTVTNPIGTAAALAGSAGLTALAWSLMDDEERRLLQEEMATARNGSVHWMLMREEERRAYERVLEGIPVGPMGGQLRLPPAAVDLGRRVWNALTPAALTLPMPEHGGESRVGSVAQLTPTGFLVDRVVGQVNLARAVTGAGEGRGHEAMLGLERLYGISAQAVLGTVAGVLTGQDPMIQALGGRGSLTEALANKMSALAGRAGVLYPKLGMFTPEGIFIGENALLEGQGWREALRGIVRAREPEGGAQRLGASTLRLFWPSRALYQKPPLRAPDDAWTAILSELYGRGFDPSSEESRTRMRAGRWVHAQLAVLMGDLYEQHFDEGGEPGAADVTLDQRMVGALRESLEHTREGLGGGREIEPGYEPKGLLLSAIQQFPPEERSAILDYLERWVSRPTFWEDGLRYLFAAGEAREMPKALFRDAMMNALADPGGTRLLAWWRAQVEEGDEETMGQLAPMIHDVAMPAPGSRGFDNWSWLMAQYARAGIELPPVPEAGRQSIDALLLEKGHARALQGGEALRNVLQKGTR